MEGACGRTGGLCGNAVDLKTPSPSSGMRGTWPVPLRYPTHWWWRTGERRCDKTICALRSHLEMVVEEHGLPDAPAPIQSQRKRN